MKLKTWSNSFNPSWEEKIYSQGKQINRYPYGELVSFVMRLYGAELKTNKRLRVLELGCGTGNNLAFLSKEGFETYGIEGSASAVAIAEKFLKDQKLVAHIVLGDFVTLPYESDSFDLIIDRESVCCNRKDAIISVSHEVRRCLKPGGRFLAFAYSIEHALMKSVAVKRIESGTYIGACQGSPIHFFTEAELRDEYFEGLIMEFIMHSRVDCVFPEPANQYAEFIACGKKPAVETKNKC